MTKMQPIRAIVYGVGTGGRVMPRLMVEKEVLIVGAIDVSPSIVGKDLGVIAGLGHALNVTISNQADAILSENEADIAVLAIFDDMERMYPLLKKCVENGLNVVTTAAEALFPWTSSPVQTSRLDKLAKTHGVTVTGAGNQDFYLVNAASLLTGLCHHIESATLRIQTNTENLGPEMSRSCHVGETKEEFYRSMKEAGEEPINLMAFCLESIIADLGLSVKQTKYITEPAIADVDMESRVLKKVVKKGFVTGMIQTVEITTAQGLRFRSEGAFKMFPAGQEDTKEWIIKGTPNAYMKFGKLEGAFTTCTQMVNRIPDIINSEPGLVTIEKLPKLKFRAYPLHWYVRQN
jgi:4-hydroxy-tetrahydrodipicolinate reductase